MCTLASACIDKTFFGKLQVVLLVCLHRLLSPLSDGTTVDAPTTECGCIAACVCVCRRRVCVRRMRDVLQKRILTTGGRFTFEGDGRVFDTMEALLSSDVAKQHLVYSIFVEYNVVYVALAKGIRLFLYTSHKLLHTNSREVLQNAGCQHTCPRDHSIRGYTQAASAARATRHADCTYLSHCTPWYKYHGWQQ